MLLLFCAFISFFLLETFRTECLFNHFECRRYWSGRGKKYLKSLNWKPNNNMISYSCMQKELELEKYFDLQLETIPINFFYTGILKAKKHARWKKLK
jgi:hypothetical protein